MTQRQPLTKGETMMTTVRIDTIESHRPWCVAVERDPVVLFLHDTKADAIEDLDEHDSDCNREVMRTDEAMLAYPDTVFA